MLHETILYKLCSDIEGAEAPKKTVRYTPHVEFLVGIGNDHTATITMETEAFNVLKQMVSEVYIK